MRTLEHRRVLVTGGARGIGLAIARAFADAGAHLVLTDLDAEALAETKVELARASVRVETYTLDVTDREGIAAVRDRVKEEVGRIEVLVNNAGLVFGGPFLDVPIEKHLATYRVNVDGVVAMTHAFLPDLIDSPEGHLVNMGSASGFIGLPYGSTYASSKWAVIGFSESIRLELKKMGFGHVGVTTVCPSYVSTGMFEGVKPPLGTRFLTAEALGAKVVKAVVKNRAFVLEPWLVKLTPFLKNGLPTSVSDRLSDLFGATSGMASWKGHE